MIAEAYIGSLNIHDLSVTGTVALSRFGGLGTPDPREDRPDRARRHGGIELTTYYHPRVWDIEGYIRGPNENALWDTLDTLKEALALNGLTHTLKWKRMGKSYLERATVVVGSTIDPVLHVSGQTMPFAMTLVSADPRLYVDTAETITFAGAGTATNSGNFSTPPTITFQGGGTNPGLRNNALAAENQINMSYTMLSGDTIVVDVGARTVKLNGIDRPDILNMATTDFWSLTTGANSLTKLGGAVSVTVDWRSARI